MAAGVAHELNNPLTTVMGFLELAMEDRPTGSVEREDLELALREAQRAREVVRRLLDFSRQSSNISIPCQMNELIQEVVPLIQHQLETSGVAIALDLGEGLPDLPANPNQIKQVILNLLQNALQAMPDGGTVSVKSGRELRSDGIGVFIKVCDTGEGIPPEYYERIFEPFFTTRPVGKGTGLGLSVSYGIITSHGGQIDVDSIMGRGSCFTVWLPAEAA
jgi:two-component system NtrC family sensor kinase